MKTHLKHISSNKTFHKNNGCKILLTASFFLLAFPADGRAQDSLRDYLNNKTEKPAKSASSAKKTGDARSRKSSASGSASRAPRKSPPKSKRSLHSVTFITSEPDVEVWINDKKAGETDENARFEKKLAAGDYRVMAKNKVGVVFPMTKISVSAESTAFKLFEEAPVAADDSPDEDAEATEKKTDAELAAEVSSEVTRIFEAYADPEKTDSVTTADWDMVYKAAQAGQLQGNSAIDVEARRWFASGQLELASENFTNAFTAFNKAMEFMPNSGLLHYALGNTYLASKQPAEALKAFQKSIQLSPKMGMAHKKLGDAYRLLDKEREAIAAYKNAVQFGYDNVETRFGLALTLLEMKQTDEAIAHLLEVEKEKPAAEVYIALGEAYEKTKRDVSAIENYQKAIQAAPGSAAAYFKLGDVYYSQREYVKAKETFEKAIELDPEGKVLTKPEAQKKLREAAAKIK